MSLFSAISAQSRGNPSSRSGLIARAGIGTLGLAEQVEACVFPAHIRLPCEKVAVLGKNVMIVPKWRQVHAIALGLILAPSGMLASAAQAAPTCIGPASDLWVTITVDRVRNSKGLITATLYPDDPKRFLVKNGSFYVASTAAAAGQTRFCLFVPRAGSYAIAIYHDEDSSGTINRGGLFGIPSEAVGFSNNPTILFGPPSLRSVLVKVERPNQTVTITLKKF
jgi:uncharacterized protein (DUF2141 family)